MAKHRAKRALWWAALLSLALIATVTIAYMFRQTETLSNQFLTSKVDCEVTEQFDGRSKSSIIVKNTGNINAYLRLRLVSYWTDENGNIAPVASEMPAVSFASGWVKSTSSDTYYYSAAVAPGGTVEFLSGSITLGTKEVNGVIYYQALDVFADAIQSQPVKATRNSWNVTIENDVITKG